MKTPRPECNLISDSGFRSVTDITPAVPANTEDAVPSNTPKMPLSTCLSVHLYNCKQECAICGSADGVCVCVCVCVCDVLAEFQCEGQTRTRWWKNTPAATSTHASFITPQFWIGLAAFYLCVCGDSMCYFCHRSWNGIMIRLHLGLVFFIKHVPGRVHVKPWNPAILHGFHLWGQ